MIAILAAAIAELCGPAPAPSAPPDAADAARYVEVGDAARADGDVRVAAVAYRAALARDPHNAAARSALDALCRAAKNAADDGSELLAAIAVYRSGELDAAETTLGQIAARNGPSAAGAHFFLGAIALQHHEGGRAVAELEIAGRDPLYAEPAATLLPLAHRDGAFAVVALVEPELDTNPALLPDTPPAGSMLQKPQIDDDLLLATTITARPTRWFYARDQVLFRKQHNESELDFFGETATAGVETPQGRDRFGLRYDFDYDLLDGLAYLYAHRATATALHDLGGVALVASYALRRRDYQDSAQAAFTGWVQTADAGAIVHATPAVDLDARATLVREHTEDPAFSDLAIGGAVAARARLAPGIRLTAMGAGWYALYDGPEPDGTDRRDVHGEASGDLEVDLGNHALATFGAGVIGNASTIGDFQYYKLVVRCGLAFAIGAP